MKISKHKYLTETDIVFEDEYRVILHITNDTKFYRSKIKYYEKQIDLPFNLNHGESLWLYLNKKHNTVTVNSVVGNENNISNSDLQFINFYRYDLLSEKNLKNSEGMKKFVKLLQSLLDNGDNVFSQRIKISSMLTEYPDIFTTLYKENEYRSLYHRYGVKIEYVDNGIPYIKKDRIFVKT